MTAHPSSNLPDQMGGVLLEQVFQLWLRPELESRGLDLTPEEIYRCLVIFEPGKKTRVLLDAETVHTLVVRGPAARAIEVGEPITENDLERVETLVPHGLKKDTRWIGFVLFKGIYTLAFDFRGTKTDYSQARAKATETVERADEFLTTARLALENHLNASAVDLLFSAAELAVVAQMTLLYDKPPGGHGRRMQWFQSWAKHGNVPAGHGHALADLNRSRSRARYTSGPLQLSDADLHRLANQVEDMVEHARQEIANRPGL